MSGRTFAGTHCNTEFAFIHGTGADTSFHCLNLVRTASIPTVVYATIPVRSHNRVDALSSVTDLWWVRRCVATGEQSDSGKSARAMRLVRAGKRLPT